MLKLDRAPCWWSLQGILWQVHIHLSPWHGTLYFIWTWVSSGALWSGNREIHPFTLSWHELHGFTEQIKNSKWKGEGLFKNRWFCSSCSHQNSCGGAGAELHPWQRREKGDSECRDVPAFPARAQPPHSPTAMNCLPIHTIHTLSHNSQLN